MGVQTTDVFIDSDMGWDDWCAISLLAKSSNINIVGLSITGCGEAYLTPAVQNALDLLSLLGKGQVPIGVGAGFPSSYSNVFPGSFRQTMSTLMGYTLQKSTTDPTTLGTADTVLGNALINYPDLTYLSIGGFTNLHNYLANSGNTVVPKSVVSMCGAVNVPGNINTLFPQAYPENDKAEWNIFIDPVSASYVIDYYQTKKLALRISPLDASFQVPLTSYVINSLVMCKSQNPLILFLSYILSTRFDQAKKGGYLEYFYDPLAASLIIDPSLTDDIQGEFKINATYDEQRNVLGAMSFSPNPTASSCYGLIKSPNDFYTLFLSTLCAD